VCNCPIDSRKDHVCRGLVELVDICAFGEEDAALSRRRHSEDKLETVVDRYGEDNWPEVGCGLFAAGQQLCTGF